jgi:drug/metabolite transporter (DMT)-like permease
MPDARTSSHGTGVETASLRVRRTRLELWTALWIVYVVWGSTYLAIKIAVRTLPPLLTAGTRFLAAAALLAAILALLGRSLRVSRREALSAAAVGIALLAFGVGLVHVAETRIDSGVAAMIAGSVPLQVVVWRLVAGERVPRPTVLAAAIGLAGLALVIGPDGLQGGAGAVGLLVMLAASVSWSRGSFASTKVTLPADPFAAAVYEMLGGGLVLVAAGLSFGELGDLDREALEAGPVAAWLYLALAGSVLGFSAYVWLLDNAPISQVVTHQYVNPLVAVGLGALLLDERPGPASLAGAALIVGAVVVTARVEGRETLPPEGAATPRPASGEQPGTRAGPSA